ncbi:MAG: hypothetical protein LBJ59_05620 [Zoogloeaceae bacterium]|jgi:hypothetical protein|nr:hypothetical protein [Zoogloeaceae bacterium]
MDITMKIQVNQAKAVDTASAEKEPHPRPNLPLKGRGRSVVYTLSLISRIGFTDT